MSIEGYQELTHDCGSKKFHQVSNLIWAEGKGQSPRPAGYICAGCGNEVDAAKLIDAAKRKTLDAKIAELEASRA